MPTSVSPRGEEIEEACDGSPSRCRTQSRSSYRSHSQSICFNREAFRRGPCEGSVSPESSRKSVGNDNGAETGDNDSDAPTSALYSFRERYPMDKAAWEFLCKASPDVQEMVMSDFRVKREGEDDYSALVIHFVGRVKKRLQPGADVNDRNPRGSDDRLRGQNDHKRQRSPPARERRPHEHRGRYDPDRGAERDRGRGSTHYIDVRDVRAREHRHEERDRSRDNRRRSPEQRRRHERHEDDRGSRSDRDQRDRRDTRDAPYARSYHTDAARRGNDIRDVGHERADGRGSRDDGGYGRDSSSDHALEKFRRRYPMDDRAFDMLRRLEAGAQEQLFAKFKPRSEGQSDYSALIVSVVRSVQSSYDGKSHSGKSHGATRFHDHDRSDGHDPPRDSKRHRASSPLSVFRKRYPMDEKAWSALRQSTPYTQDIVVQGFKPKREGDDDYSALIMCYVRSIEVRSDARDSSWRDRRDGRGSSWR